MMMVAASLLPLYFCYNFCCFCCCCSYLCCYYIHSNYYFVCYKFVHNLERHSLQNPSFILLPIKFLVLFTLYFSICLSFSLSLSINYLVLYDCTCIRLLVMLSLMFILHFALFFFCFACCARVLYCFSWCVCSENPKHTKLMFLFVRIENEEIFQVCLPIASWLSYLLYFISAVRKCCKITCACTYLASKYVCWRW